MMVGGENEHEASACAVRRHWSTDACVLPRFDDCVWQEYPSWRRVADVAGGDGDGGGGDGDGGEGEGGGGEGEGDTHVQAPAILAPEFVDDGLP